MANPPLYTIGHGARRAEDFIALLQQYGILRLVDVRSVPYSRFHPRFRKEALAKAVSDYGIDYIFMGDTLGGRPSDPACYDEAGHIDYNLVAKTESFHTGIHVLEALYAEGAPTAIMCSESDPRTCHRARLISPFLKAKGYDIRHIDEKGRLKDHEVLAQALNKTARLDL